MKRSTSFVGGALLAALPLGALVSGCGSGNGGGLIGGVPTATPVATATPTSTSTALGSAPVTFRTGQTGTLNLTRTGNSVSGTLVVNAATNAAPARSVKAFSFSLSPGTYSVSGTFSPPRGFQITGNFPAPIGAFSISGTVPTPTDPGSYSLTANGQTVTGAYPRIGTVPTGTATPIPTAASGGSFNGTIVPSGTSNFGTQAFVPNTFAGISTTSGNIKTIALTATETAVVGAFRRSLVVTVSSTSALSRGQVLPVTSASSFTFPSARVNPVITQNQVGQIPGSWGNITVIGGTVTIREISATSISLDLSNVRVVGDLGSATGTLIVNGTLTSNYR